MLIALHNSYSRLVASTSDERRWLRDYLTFADEKAHFRKWGARPQRMLNELTGDFPSGFIPMIHKAAGEEGLEVQVIDKRLVPATVDMNPDLNSWLRDYQVETVTKALAEVRGILWLPTGAGKTEIAVALAERIQVPWAFLVSSGDLLHQTAARFEKRTGEEAGVIGDGTWEPKRFNVCTFQTLAARVDDPRLEQLFERTLALLVDESHQLPADSFWRIAMKFKQAYWRYGMSGTPLARTDRRSILSIAALGPVIHRIRPEVLIDAGVLARPTIRLIPCEQDSAKASIAGVYTDLITKSKVRNGLVVEAARRALKPCIVFVKAVEHGKLLMKQLEAAGLTAEFVWGDKNTHQRDAAIRRLIHGDTEVLVASVVFNVGIDIPDLRSLVIAAAGKSVIAAIQRVGRGMRVVEGKTTFEVWDFADKGNRWMANHARTRKKAYLGEGYQVVEASELVTKQTSMKV